MFGKAKRIMGSFLAVVMTLSTITPVTPVTVYAGDTTGTDGTGQTTEFDAAQSSLSTGGTTPESISMMSLARTSSCTCIISVDALTDETVNLGNSDFYLITYSDKITDSNSIIPADSVHVAWDSACPVHATMSSLTDEEKVNTIKDELYISSIRVYNAEDIFETVTVSNSINLQDLREEAWFKNTGRFMLEIGVGYESILNGTGSPVAKTNKHYTLERSLSSDFGLTGTWTGSSTVNSIDVSASHDSLTNVHITADGGVIDKDSTLPYSETLTLSNVGSPRITNMSVEGVSSTVHGDTLSREYTVSDTYLKNTVDIEMHSIYDRALSQNISVTPEDNGKDVKVKSMISVSSVEGILEDEQTISLTESGVGVTKSYTNDISSGVSTFMVMPTKPLTCYMYSEVSDDYGVINASTAYSGEDKCSCHYVLTVSNVTINKDLGNATGGFIPISNATSSTDYPLDAADIDYTWNDACPLHVFEPDEAKVKQMLAISNITKNTSDISTADVVDGGLEVKGLGNGKDSGFVSLKATLGEDLMATPIQFDIEVNVTRKTETPVIESAEIVGDKLILVVDPKGNSEAKLFIGGAQWELGTTSKNIEFAEGEYGYAKATVELTGFDKVLPVVNSATATRNVDKTVSLNMSFNDVANTKEIKVEGVDSATNSKVDKELTVKLDSIDSYLEYRIVNPDSSTSDWKLTAINNTETDAIFSDIPRNSNIEIRAVDLSGNRSDSMVIDVEELTCTCGLTVVTTRTIEANIGSSTAGAVNLNAYFVDISNEKSPIKEVQRVHDPKCPVHESENYPNVETTGFALNSVTNLISASAGNASVNVDSGNYTLGIDSLEVELSEMVLEGTIKKSEEEIYTVQFPLNIIRADAAPIISSWKYNATTETATILVEPVGNSNTEIFSDSVSVGYRNFDFVEKGFWMWKYKEYINTEFSFRMEDNVAPLEAYNINLVRKDTDQTMTVLSWDYGTDADNYIPVQVQSKGHASNEVMVNAKSEQTTKEIIVYDAAGTELSRYTTKDNQLEIPVINLYYGGHLTIQTFDDNDNASGIMTYQLPNNVVYNTVVVDDVVAIEESTDTYVDVKLNDIHDEAYNTPLIESVTVVAGNGTATLMDSEKITDKPDTMVGLVVFVESPDGNTEPIEIIYTYAQVRDDIPAASGKLTVTIKPRNQEPEAIDDSADITKSINAEANTTFHIPLDMILANDTDREIQDGTSSTPLTVTEIRNCSAGEATLDLVNNRIIVVPTRDFTGYLTLEYRITDGKALSRFWGVITVYVKNSIVPPTAREVSTVMELTAKEHTITLLVENPSAVQYTLDSPLEVRLAKVGSSEEIVIDSSKISAVGDKVWDAEMGMEKPFIRLTMNDVEDLNLAVDDMLIIDYTVRNQKGSSAAAAKVTMTVGDDPYDMEGYLYVHRRPLALFTAKVQRDSTKTYITGVDMLDFIEGGETKSQETSYDLDHQTQHAVWRPEKPYTYKGLRTWEWGVKTLDGTWITKQFDADDAEFGGSALAARAAGIQWINSQTNQVITDNPKTSIVIALRVRDVDGPDDIGEWSEQRSMLLASIPMKPVALFTLDKSTYTVPPQGEEFKVFITDLSYDSNGDNINLWEWTLTDPSGKTIHTQSYPGVNGFDAASFSTIVSNKIAEIVRASTYNPTNPSFKLSLVVQEDTNERLKSDKYSVSFEVFKENEAPIIEEKAGYQLGTVETATLYEIDDGIDGKVGDNWGTAGNTTKRGIIDFKNLLTITDDQSDKNLRVSWLFEGQKVMKRIYHVDGGDSDVSKMYRDLTYNPFVAPFTHTVTDEGFKPGAYKLTVSVVDNPTGNAYASNSGKTSYWSTNSNYAPYHLYVVPKLDMYMHNEVNGWIDQSYTMVGDTKVEYDEMGLEMEDIAPTIGDTIRIFGTTNQYVMNMYVFNDLNNNNKVDLGEDKLKMTQTKQNLDTTKEWEVFYELQDVAEAPAGSDLTVLNIKILGETTWGGEQNEVTRTKIKEMSMKALPVKLYDFRVTSVTDPDVYSDFKGHLDALRTLGFTLPSGGLLDGVPVGKLAVDRTSTEANADGTLNDQTSAVSKGYSFYFKISSKGMAKDDDEIRIVPRFYEAITNEDGKTTGIGNELAGYLPDENGVYRIYTSEMPDTVPQKVKFEKMYELFYEGSMIHSLGQHYDMRIPKSLRSEDGNSQTWSGRYGIPSDAKFFRYGSTPNIANEYKGDILITFDITAYKNDRPRYNYVERGQWAKERAVIPESLKVVYGAKESDWKASDIFNGAIITFDATRSLVDNYISNPVWRE